MSLEDLIVRIDTALEEHRVADVRAGASGPLMRCTCQPDDGYHMPANAYRRHVAMRIADVATRIDYSPNPSED